MFWGCFSYDKKGPMHIWSTETAQEKTRANAVLEALNALREPNLRMEWELMANWCVKQKQAVLIGIDMARLSF